MSGIEVRRGTDGGIVVSSVNIASRGVISSDWH